MIKSAKDFGIKILLCLLACFSLLTCGIEEYYYLPQVPENNIKTSFNDSATMDIPSIDLIEHYYATDYGYRIYYRIYLSGASGGSLNTDFSNSFVTDYNALKSLADPTNTSSIPTAFSFSNRGYYELDYTIDTNGGTFVLMFPTNTSYPTITKNGGSEENLRRYKNSSGNYEFVPDDSDHEITFRNTAGLKEPPDKTSRMNMDVASSSENEFAYAAMYIVAIGQNPTTFTIIYGKPTFISVFKLPNS